MMDDRERRLMEKQLQLQKELVGLYKTQCELLQIQNDILRRIAGLPPKEKEEGNE